MDGGAILAAKPRLKKAKVADLFCGAGGSSTGARRALRALGYQMELLCVNHWPVAIETHRRNHPEARHYCQDVETVRPHIAVPEGRLDLLMASPTCTYHSRARGGKPIADQQRMDPWHVVTWLTELRVRCLIIENVPEFVRWGPVNIRTGRPLKPREGEYFLRWIETIRGLGFKVDWRVLNCADYGDATTRERFFLIARSDGKPLRWPEPTHARNPGAADLFGRQLKPWRAAREIIDWSIEGKSIFDRKKPLSPKTLRRIYAGICKFGWPEPFIVVLRNHMAAQGLDAPLPTITAGGTHLGLAEPVILSTRQHTGGPAPRSADDPLPTLTATDSRIGVVEPFVLNRHGENGAVRAHSVDEPVPTVTQRGGGYVVEPFILSRHAEGAPRSVEEPTPTQVAKHSHILVEPLIVRTDQTGGNGLNVRTSEEPLPTVTTNGGMALIAPYYGSGSGESCSGTDKPLPTVTTKARFGLVVPVTHGGEGNRARDVGEPLPTITCAKRGELAFIAATFGERPGQAPRVHSIDDPTPTICATGRIPLVQPGRDFDIRFRMLEPHELGAAMSFHDDEMAYEFVGNKTQVTAQIGNAVPVRMAAALVGALMA